MMLNPPVQFRIPGPDDLAARMYLHQMDESAACADDGANIFRPDPECLRRPGVRLYSWLWETPNRPPTFMAGLRCERRAGDVLFAGAVVAPRFRQLQLLTTLVARARLREAEEVPDHTHVANVRVYRDGGINAASNFAFAACGFRTRRVVHHALGGTALDHHLEPTSESDGTVRALELVATPASLRLARRILAGEL